MSIIRRLRRAEPPAPEPLNRIEALYRHLDKREAELAFPLRVDIETTNECNLRCPMCARTTAMDRAVGDMSFETFRRICDELGQHDIEFVSLHVFGEPLMHPQIFEFIEYIKQYERIAMVGLSTNVTVLDERRREGLLSSRLDFVNLALDAAHADAYANTRGANFEHAARNARRFLERRREVGSDMLVHISLIPMVLNESDLSDFREQWDPYCDDRVEVKFKPFGDFAGQVPDYGVDSADDAGIKVQFVVRTKDGSPPPPRVPCALPWESVTIHAAGDVVACCLDVNGQLHLGNVHEKSIEQIWSSSEMRRLREAHRSLHFEQFPLCDRCANTYEPILDVIPMS